MGGLPFSWHQETLRKSHASTARCLGYIDLPTGSDDNGMLWFRKAYYLNSALPSRYARSAKLFSAFV
jgi:hypothetical protein